ncbi:plasmid mobilization protein [Pedobacter sp. GR22-6]|uniref:plasmid mobilization protein n=1 Tax=Pedobacter sp. GR22-6 TaxID=3127957 RepID=UPI00307E20C8
MESGKREFLLKAKLTAEEHKQVLALARQLGVSRSDLVKSRLLAEQRPVLINGVELLSLLDGLGAELGRSGNNINQLARHANILNKRGMLDGEVVLEFNDLFAVYLRHHLEIQKLMRSLIRLMKG